MRLADRHDQHAGDRRQHGAEREDAGIDAVDRNGEGLGGFAVILGGAHQKADLRARQNQPGGDQQQRRDGDDGKLVAGIAKPRQEHAVAERRRDRPRLRAVEGQRQLLDDIEQADGGDDGGFGIVVQPPEHKAFGQQRDGADDERRHHQRRDEAHGGMCAKHVGDHPGKHSAEHEELAVRDVDDAHDAEHQRQAERRQRQHRGADKAFEHGEQEMRSEGHSGFVLGERWPLAGGVDNGDDPNGVVTNFIDQTIVIVGQNLPGIRQGAYMSGEGKIAKPFRGDAKSLVDA